MKPEEKEQEYEYLKKVLGLLQDRYAVLLDELEKCRQNVAKSNSEMWDEVTHVVQDFDDIVALSMQTNYLQERVNSYENTATELKRVKTQLDVPYFGRIDFTAEGEKTPDKLYIGAYSFMAQKTFDNYITDWRAPIASMFYDYEIGPAGFEANGTKHSGQLVLKRQYKISGGKMEYMYDTSAAIQDELLGRVLSESTSPRLRTIIASIQKEQNSAIRYPLGHCLLVTGPAGSGKTSVGLHRLAYLLYHNRNKILSSQIVAVSNNNIFSSYIAGVLPELGEADMNRVVFPALLQPYYPEGYTVHDYYEQQGSLLSGEETGRIRRVELKYSAGFFTYLQNHVGQKKVKLPNLYFAGNMICSAEQLESKIGADAQAGYSVMRRRALYLVKNCYKDYFAGHQAEVEQYIRSQSSDILFRDEIKRLYKRCLATHVQQAEEAVKNSNPTEPLDVYTAALYEYCSEKGCEDIYEETMQLLSQGQMLYEDMICTVCVKALMGGLRTFDQVRHVLIDEAQDYSLFQIMLIKLFYPKSSFTMLADINQAVTPGASLKGYEEMKQLFGNDFTHLHMQQSYRSTAAINDLACGLINKPGAHGSVKRHGKKPAYIKTADAADAIKEIVRRENEEGHSVGILTMLQSEAFEAHKKLKDMKSIKLIARPAEEMNAKNVVMPVLLAKGLEFDTVIIYGTPQIQLAENRNILYLMCTRALHSLYWVSDEKLPESLSDCREYFDVSE